jgi:hypothetical protein
MRDHALPHAGFHVRLSLTFSTGISSHTASCTRWSGRPAAPHHRQAPPHRRRPTSTARDASMAEDGAEPAPRWSTAGGAALLRLRNPRDGGQVRRHTSAAPSLRGPPAVRKGDFPSGPSVKPGDIAVRRGLFPSTFTELGSSLEARRAPAIPRPPRGAHQAQAPSAAAPAPQPCRRLASLMVVGAVPMPARTLSCGRGGDQRVGGCCRPDAVRAVQRGRWRGRRSPSRRAASNPGVALLPGRRGVRWHGNGARWR